MLLEVLERAKLLGGIKSKVMYVFVFIYKVMGNMIFRYFSFGADTYEPGWLDLPRLIFSRYYVKRRGAEPDGTVRCYMSRARPDHF